MSYMCAYWHEALPGQINAQKEKVLQISGYHWSNTLSPKCLTLRFQLLSSTFLSGVNGMLTHWKVTFPYKLTRKKALCILDSRLRAGILKWIHHACQAPLLCESCPNIIQLFSSRKTALILIGFTHSNIGEYR